MQSSFIIAYQQLKEAVANKLCEAHPSLPNRLSEWKGQAIALFQEELARSVNGRVSEKWFYTHLKPTEIKKLPRTDMLDLLSRFVGYTDWETFLSQSSRSEERQETVWERKTALFLGLAILVLIGVGATWLTREDAYQYRACIVDGYMLQAVPNEGLQVYWLKDHETPMALPIQEKACIELETEDEMIRLAIVAPYFKEDTVVRKLSTSRKIEEKLRLMPDDYALMIHYFSNAKIEDWKKRKAQLNEMFANDAQILQVDNRNVGMELYNKQEFVNKLIMPLNSLKNIRILATKYNRQGKIQHIRFIQEE